METGPLCAFLASATWAIGASGYARLSRTHSPFAVNLARSLIAGPLFLLTAFALAGSWSAGLAGFRLMHWSHFGWFALSMFASYGFGDVLFLLSTRSLGVPAALAIASSYPLLTALMGYFFEGQALSPAQVLGLGITVTGVITVILSGAQSEKKIVNWKGVALAATCSVFWATNSLSISRAGHDIPAAVANSVRMGLAICLSLVMGTVFAPGSRLFLSIKDIKSYLWIFLIEAFGGSYFFMYGLSHSRLAIGATLSSLAPVLSVPVAWALGIEKFSVRRTVGVFLVVLGLCLLVGPVGSTSG
jgi:drug/metabolite transporter (DMT)-like permease